MTCIGCPMGCALEVTKGPAGEIAVTGAGCGRGVAYARQESIAPKRMVTGLVAVRGTRIPLSVKTAAPVAKEKISAVLACLRAVTVDRPIRIGQVILPNLCGTGVALVATSDRSA